MPNNAPLKKRMANAAVSFRGYNVSNLGRSAELLAHPEYGTDVAELLDRASAICSKSCGRKVDLVQRVHDKCETTVKTFAEDVSMIVAMSVAHIHLLEKFFDIPIKSAKMMLGYSIGELAATMVAGMFEMEEILPLPLFLSGEAASLAENVTMGVVFTRDQSLKLSDVRRLCVKISSEGKGIIAPSTQLAPNAILVLGEGHTLDRFQEVMKQEISDRLLLRRNKNKWPPLHTPILWKKNIPNRGALSLFSIQGGFIAPKPPIVSCVTGKKSYNDWNSRDILVQWIDQPQLLWDALYHVLDSGVDVVIHVGPEPNLIPSTFQRLSQNVLDQMNRGLIGRLGKTVAMGIARRQWLSGLLTSQSAILRAPFIEHIILEDWLLEQKPLAPPAPAAETVSAEETNGESAGKESAPPATKEQTTTA